MEYLDVILGAVIQNPILKTPLCTDSASFPHGLFLVLWFCHDTDSGRLCCTTWLQTSHEEHTKNNGFKRVYGKRILYGKFAEGSDWVQDRFLRLENHFLAATSAS